MPGAVALVLVGFHTWSYRSFEAWSWSPGSFAAVVCALVIVGCAGAGAWKKWHGLTGGADRAMALGLLGTGIALTLTTLWPWWRIRYSGGREITEGTSMLDGVWGTSLALAALSVVVLAVAALVVGPRFLPWAVIPGGLAVVFSVLSHSYLPSHITVLEGETEPGLLPGAAAVLVTAGLTAAVAVMRRGMFRLPRVEHPVRPSRGVAFAVVALLAAGSVFLPEQPSWEGQDFLWNEKPYSTWGQSMILLCLASAALGCASAAGRARLRSALLLAGLMVWLCLRSVIWVVYDFIDFKSGLAFRDGEPLFDWSSSFDRQWFTPGYRFVLIFALSVALFLIALPWRRRAAVPRSSPAPWVPPFPPQPAYFPVPPPAPAPSPVRHEPGLLAGRYRLLERVGQGGMGSVWRALDEMLRLEVAVKEVVFPPGLGHEQRAQLCERAMREARALARLRAQPQVVTVYDALLEDGRPWLIMELVPGRSLARVIEDEGRLDPVRVARLGLELLDALTAAHGVDILHRDVKPANVLVSDADRVVLTDFGIAMQGGETSLTLSGALIGSPGYIAPERLRGEADGPEGDLWSLGATLYHAVEGEPAYRASQPAVLLASILMEEPAESLHAGPLLPALTGMLRRDPADRWTADRVRAHLQAVVQGTPSD